MVKRSIRLLSRLGLRVFRGVFRAVPHGVAVRMGAAMGTIVYYLFARRRRLAAENLAAAYPELSARERAWIVKRVFRNFGRGLAEFLRTARLDAAEVSRLVEADGLHHLDEALEGGKGALLITAHIGNWELMARHLTDLGYKLSVVARDVDDRSTNEIVNEIRRDNGYKVFSRGNAARFILRCLGRNEFVGILPDQNAADLFVEFFGRPCGTVTGPAVMHMRTGAPIIPIFCVRLPEDRHRIEVKPPLRLQPTGDPDADVLAIMTGVHRAIEDQVRRYPDQWLWFHDRWKAARKRQEPSRAG